jgi:23S rRNA (guanosine2251-2'-O)-methyltransferase
MMEKETKIYGLRAIIEAVEAENTIDKVFLQKGLSGELFTELEKLLRKQNINFTYVPLEKLNRLNPTQPSRGCS